MLCALIQENICVETRDLDEIGISTFARSYQLVIDISTTYPQPQVGWTFDGSQWISNGSYSMVITKLALQNRFTDAEFMGILQYCDNTSNPYCYAIRMILQKQANAQYIDLNRSDTQRGLQVLVAAGRITPDRATAILTTPPTALEVYKGTL